MYSTSTNIYLWGEGRELDYNRAPEYKNCLGCRLEFRTNICQFWCSTRTAYRGLQYILWWSRTISGLVRISQGYLGECWTVTAVVHRHTPQLVKSTSLTALLGFLMYISTITDLMTSRYNSSTVVFIISGWSLEHFSTWDFLNVRKLLYRGDFKRVFLRNVLRYFHKQCVTTEVHRRKTITKTFVIVHCHTTPYSHYKYRYRYTIPPWQLVLSI